MGVPVVLADPRDLVFNGKTLTAHGKKIELLYRRVLINDIVARPQECAALVKAYEANAVVRSQYLPLQNPPRESVLRGSDRRTKRRSLFARRARNQCASTFRGPES